MSELSWNEKQIKLIYIYREREKERERERERGSERERERERERLALLTITVGQSIRGNLVIKLNSLAWVCHYFTEKRQTIVLHFCHKTQHWNIVKLWQGSFRDGVWGGGLKLSKTH